MNTLPVNTTTKPPEVGMASVEAPRFATVPSWVASHSHILSHPTSLAVYVHLFLLGNFRTRVTTSDWREITGATGWSKPTVMRAMKVLREAGAVVRDGDDIRLPMDQPAGIKSDTDADGQYQIRHRGASDVIPAPLYTENSEIPPDGGVLPLDGITPDPLAAARSQLTSMDQDFETWWKAYPRKVDKKMAKRSYIARRRADAQPSDLLAAAKHYAAARRDSEPTFIKHGSTFLNNGWDEWIEGDPEPRPTPQAQREYVHDVPTFG